MNDDSTPTPPDCPRCGRPLPPTAPRGLCPRCLLARLVLTEAEEDFQDGAQRLADYDLLEPIARGGMGIVYRARQRSLGRTVAVKLILAGELATPDFIERFQIEAEAAARLEHPNIIPIYEVGQAEGRHFFSMKLVEGGNLAERLAKGGRFSLPDSVRLTIKLARAVHFAHQRGILHRDIKPNNVLLDSQAEPVLTDFGLAKLVEKDSQITHTLAVIGTPSYISPEQAAGKVRQFTTAVDVYGLGALFYELLCGVPPFAGGTTLATIRLVLEKDPERPSRRNPEVDRDLETICLKCLEKEPARRYQSAESLAEDLERWLAGEPIQARPIGAVERLGKWMRRNPAKSVSILVALVAMLSIAVISETSRQRVGEALLVSQRQKTEIELQRTKIARTQAETVRQLSHSLSIQAAQHAASGRNSSALAFWAQALRLDPSNHVAASRIFHTLVRSSFVEPLTPPLDNDEYAMASTFSPDGSKFIVGSHGTNSQLFIRDAVDGRLLRSIKVGDPVMDLAFSPDGTRLVTYAGRPGVEKGRISLWEVSTGDRVWPDFHCEHGGYEIRFSPDGESVAIPWAGAPLVLDARTGKLRYPLPDPANGIGVSSLQWGLDPGLIFGLCSDGLLRQFKVDSGEVLKKSEIRANSFVTLARAPDARLFAVVSAGGKSVLLISSHTLEVSYELPTEQPVHSIAFSPDGRHLVTCGDEALVRVWSIEGKPVKVLSAGAPLSTPRFNASGSRVTAIGLDQSVRVWSLPEGEPVCEPLQLGQRVMTSCLNPQGDRVLTTCFDGSAELWQANPIRVGQLTIDAGDLILDVHPSRDERRVFVGTPKGISRWLLDTGSRLPELAFPPGFSGAPEYSPDERFLMIPGAGVAVLEMDSGESVGRVPTPVEGVAAAELSPDGRRVAVCDRKGHLTLWDWRTGERTGPELQTIPDTTRLRFQPEGDYLLAGGWRNSIALVNLTLGQKSGVRLRCDNTTPVWDWLGQGDRFFHTAGFIVHFLNPETVKQAPYTIFNESGSTLFKASPDGRRMATTARDNLVREFDTLDGRPLIQPVPQPSRVTCLEFDGHNRRLAAATVNGDLELFHADTGESLTGPLSHQENGVHAEIVHLKFTRDDRRLLMAGADHQVRIWDLGPGPDDPIPAWLPELAEAIAGLKLSGVVGQRSLQLEPVSIAQRRAVREQLRYLRDGTRWAQLPRWFYGDSEQRALSPYYEPGPL